MAILSNLDDKEVEVYRNQQLIKECCLITRKYYIDKMCSIHANLHIEAESSTKITDYKYSPNGQLLAVSNSEGKVIIHKKTDKKFKAIGEFIGDQASIWSIAWGDPKYGNIIAIGTFKNKVAIFQQVNSNWKEIASHQLHEASVNCVEWSPCGFKLFAGGSDGKISILQLIGKTWKTSIFPVSQSAITSLCLQPLALADSISQQQEDQFYCRIASISKDQRLRIWAHQNQQKYNESSQIFNGKNANKCGYSLVKDHQIQKQTIRNILWRPTWGSFNDSFKGMKFIYCSEEGGLKQIQFQLNEDKNAYNCHNQYSIFEVEFPVVRVSQSLTGNMISASIAEKQNERTLIYTEINADQWEYCEAQ